MWRGTTDRRGRRIHLSAPLHGGQASFAHGSDGLFSHITNRKAQHIEFVTHHSVSAPTIQRRLWQSGLSARRPLLGLHLTQNHGASPPPMVK
ncbi:transposable element Tcb1 transposase [Trichonephila clavipes]|nr:transposable element Tcb1 transposase [Trichonephila clavipes]